ncbi:MAG: isoprenyl transferase [Planctomycetia bacterium]|nr:isoprenyl transferase [Planctomycetia bacterium]
MPTKPRYTPDALQSWGITTIPRHIAIIMDGNGRWAGKRDEVRTVGHRQGAGSVRVVVEECCRLGIEQLTLFCLSSENWKRPQTEIDFLMALLKEFLIEEREEILEQDIKFMTIGRREPLPADVLHEIDTNCRLSEHNHGMTLCLAINYGSRIEIVDAVQQLARKVQQGQLKPEQIDEASIGQALYTAGCPDPDLLIRTAGEMRISNFLLWQISYAELYVTDLYWPDFDREALFDAVRTFGKRERRFGGLTDLNA